MQPIFGPMQVDAARQLFLGRKRINKTYWYGLLFDGGQFMGVIPARSQVWVDDHAEEWCEAAPGREFTLMSGRDVIAFAAS